MYIELNQDDMDALYQSHKEIMVKIDLYEYAPDPNEVFVFRKIDEISGVVLDGSQQTDADSDVRRTASLSIHVRDSSFVISSDSRIWMDKYINILIGWESLRSGNVLWYPLGFYKMNEAKYAYSDTEQSLTLDLADLTVMLDGTHTGDIWGAAVKIEADSKSIQRAMRDILHDRGNWYKDWIEPIGPYGREEVVTANRIPYTIEMSTGATVQEVIVKLRDLYPGYETYFDLDGTFRCNRIPDCTDDPVVMTHDQIMPILLEESSHTIDMSQVRNVTEVFGKSYDSAGYFSDQVLGFNGNYVATYEDYKQNEPLENEYFSFVPNHANTGACTLKVNESKAIPIIMYIPGSLQDKEIPAGLFQQGCPVRLRYERGENGLRFVYIGRTNIHAVNILTSREPSWVDKAYDITKYNCHNISYTVNPDSPLTREKIGDRVQVLAGGDYENIMNESDAIDRAEYETWKANNLAYNLSITTLLVPWLDVNQKISYYSPLFEMKFHEQGQEPNYGNAPQYIIKRIDRKLTEGTQTMELVRFYNQYPFIISGNSVRTSR